MIDTNDHSSSCCQPLGCQLSVLYENEAFHFTTKKKTSHKNIKETTCIINQKN
jgi:hypothetical protein